MLDRIKYGRKRIHAMTFYTKKKLGHAALWTLYWGGSLAVGGSMWPTLCALFNLFCGIFQFYRASSYHASAVLAVAILSVRLSVCRTRALWQNQTIHCRYFAAIRKGNLVFWHQQWLVGDAPYRLKFAFKATHPLRKTPTSTDFRW